MTETEPPDPSWSDIADWYDELLVSGSGPHQTALDCLADLLLPVDGLDVIDVACGQGIASRLTAGLGGRVVGVDSSARMIANARRHGGPGGDARRHGGPGGDARRHGGPGSDARTHGVPDGTDLRYEVADAQTLSPFESGSFDAATCQLALMDIPDLDATLASIARVLRPGGWLAFVIGHPCFLVPGATPTTDGDGRPAVTLTGYFDERFWRSSNPNGVRRAGNHHRTLSAYLNALVSAGFAVEECREPVAGALLAEQQPLYAEVPIFFAARVRRQATHG